jgi:hypothetical protein
VGGLYVLQKMTHLHPQKNIIIICSILIVILGVMYSTVGGYAAFVLIPIWIISSAYTKYVLCDNYLMRRNEKMIYSEIVEVKDFLIWRVITDVHHQSMWITYSLLGRENKKVLDEWLFRDDKQNKSAHTNPLPAE